jgi:hypothetical protein
MFRHVALFRFESGTTPDQIAGITDRLVRVAAGIHTIRAYAVGPDVAISDGSFDYAVVADFDDADGYLAYRDHPDHVAAATEAVQPILAERATVQYEFSPA